jgi:thiol peroxidase
LPFAQSRFCEAEGIDGVVTLSEMRDRSFGKAYGIEIEDSPVAGLLARSVIILDEHGTVVYTQQVDELSREPDYASALAALSGENEPLPVCTGSFHAEDARADDFEEPCDDGRAG